MPGLWGAGVGLFAVNCWILGIIVGDVGREGSGSVVKGNSRESVDNGVTGADGKHSVRGKRGKKV